MSAPSRAGASFHDSKGPESEAQEFLIRWAMKWMCLVGFIMDNGEGFFLAEGRVTASAFPGAREIECPTRDIGNRLYRTHR